MSTQSYDFNHAASYLKVLLVSKGLFCRGNWERSFKDGFWSELDNDLDQAIDVWKELNLDHYVQAGSDAAKKYLATLN